MRDSLIVSRVENLIKEAELGMGSLLEKIEVKNKIQIVLESYKLRRNSCERRIAKLTRMNALNFEEISH